MRKWLWFSIILLALSVGAGATAVLLQTRSALNPPPYPAAAEMADYQRCGSTDVRPYRRGYNLTTFNCYLTDDTPGQVSGWYRQRGYTYQDGAMARHVTRDTLLKITLTHQIHTYQSGTQPTRIRVTSNLTVHLPRVQLATFLP